MSTLLTIGPNSVLSSFPDRTRTINPLLHRTHHLGLSNHSPFLRGTLGLVRLGFNQVQFPDPDSVENLLRHLFGRSESFLFTIADAAASTKQNSDWLSGITFYMENVLKVLADGLATLHVPYAYGFAIILLAVLVKAATFPLSKKQVESAMAIQSLQPQIKAIQQRYTEDQERIHLETARLYKLAGINPLAGCLPTLATIPIWVGLYRVLSNAADERLLTEGFFWIPSLSGPTTIAARQNGIGISWLFPFVDGHPPLGWSDTLPYLILPVLLVLSQYISVQIMQSSQGNDPSLKNSQAITKFLPLMIGYFSLSVPSGLSLYWLTSNILGTAQQVWLQKLGGAKNPVSKFSDNIIKEQSQIRKSMLETSTIKTELKVEKLTSEGPRPGERFKQIKDQEARRRQKIEEEWRKNGGHKNEGNSVQRESGAGAESSDTEIESGNSMSGICNSSGTGHHVVDGDLSTVDSKEDQKTSVLEMESSEVSANLKDARGDQNLHEDPEKE
ncbi:ALBINO3-like protein 1, chloroplastic [Camellia sinensis]|uniref:ALBINO3-like protein 1, chloroplastic n=1 Tax=Camellia sinensis TaxID=4442 RepID=UPI0010356340|nr:ALBINO3-like protein 1, chloroplastic [Camellia sinensis]